jgi:hypothetical protein
VTLLNHGHQHVHPARGRSYCFDSTPAGRYSADSPGSSPPSERSTAPPTCAHSAQGPHPTGPPPRAR